MKKSKNQNKKITHRKKMKSSIRKKKKFDQNKNDFGIDREKWNFVVKKFRESNGRLPMLSSRYALQQIGFLGESIKALENYNDIYYDLIRSKTQLKKLQNLVNKIAKYYN